MSNQNGDSNPRVSFFGTAQGRIVTAAVGGEDVVCGLLYSGHRRATSLSFRSPGRYERSGLCLMWTVLRRRAHPSRGQTRRRSLGYFWFSSGTFSGNGWSLYR